MNKLLAEFLGTFFFCAVALLSASPLAAAGALAGLGYALGSVSGGHFNPAVSLAVWMRGKMDGGEMLRYAGAQLGGALGAWALYQLLSKPELVVQAMPVPYFRAFLGEICFTFLAAFTYLHVRTARQQLGNGYFGAAQGLVHYAGTSAIGQISGGACNPALGLALVLVGRVPGSLLLFYIIGGAIAGAGAAIGYRLLNPND